MLVVSILASWPRRAAGAVLAVVSLVLTAGCALPRAAEAQPSGSPSVSVAASSNESNRLIMRFDGHVATAVLDDTAAAREFAETLPVTLHLSDPMGQAKSGRLPHAGSLDVAGAERSLRPQVGELAYWSPSWTVAIFYDDLGQRVPPPGLVRLGVIDTGMDEVAAAGNSFTIRIDLAAETGS
jgi:hypothetical protein